MSDEELVFDGLEESGDEEVDDEHKHNKLLDAISSLDGKKKHKHSQRTVLTNQISEFNFSSSKDSDGRVKLHELLGSLKDSTSHGELKKQLRAVDISKKVASVPLPKHEKEKIGRTVAYEKTTVDLSKWDPVVKQNRRAEQIHFPLQKPDLRLISTNKFVQRFQPRTPLEQQVAALIQGSDNVVQEPHQELTPAEQRALRAMDVAEAKERRRELMKHRALLSYKEAKAKRQKKIKSKQYHRILKKERLKKESKEMETLRQTDPEGFLEKLKEMEKDRVTERISLKHRGGSKFARRQMIYAKYDNRAREQIQDMIQRNKELTKKMEVDLESDDEVAAADEDTADGRIGLEGGDLFGESSSSNPWMAKPKVKNINKFSRPAEIKADEFHDTNITNEFSRPVAMKNSLEEEQVIQNDKSIKIPKPISAAEKVDTELKSSSQSADVEDIEGDADIDKAKDAIDDIFENKVGKKSTVIETKEKGTRKRSTKRSAKKHDKAVERKEQKVKGERRVTKSKKDIDGNEKADKTKIGKELSESLDQTLYDSDDDGLISESLTRKRTLEEIEKEDDETTDILPVKLARVSKSEEAELKEEIKKPTSLPAEAFVDPNKLFTLETKLRQVGAGPDIIGVGNDNEEADSDVDAEEQQRMTIAQAFADDDVIDEFTREKADEVEKNKPKDIDLSIPGWGEWGGEGLQMSKKKRKRFIIKAPPAAPRSDKHLGHVIINETQSKELAKHRVSSIPFPFKNVQQFEQSIRAPIGRTWNPETAFRKLVEPKVVTHMGKIITPMDKEEVFKDMKKPKSEDDSHGNRKYKHHKANKGHKSKGHVKSGRQLKNKK